ncbi:MAG: hypothetical protein MUF81_11840 [Verrucomicrobia bacterium]|jgi:hypothetical protein|nr:hypothetical protein [Verrucomicrobiota bacterium]
MTAPLAGDWQELFAPCAPDRARATIELNVVRRDGQPFLLLPTQARLASRSLALYPAQTTKARAAKLLFNFALRLGLKPRLEKIPLPLADDDPFARFLAETAKVTGGIFPRFAILAGNPRAEGRRFVFLLFDAGGRPAAVVKAGSSGAARRMLTHEEHFLQTAPPQARGLPKLRATLNSPRAQAFALDFFGGHPPRLDDTGPLAELLTSWVAAGRLVAIKDLDAWQRLVAAAADRPLPGPVRALADTQVHATLAHGDCAPWNVKVAHGKWTLLDWERSELAGVPGWDWFHFVMQPAVLVRREAMPGLLTRFERLLAGEDFVRYARHAGMAGSERALALAYLCYRTRITRQTEGLEALVALEHAATERWFSATG